MRARRADSAPGAPAPECRIPCAAGRQPADASHGTPAAGCKQPRASRRIDGDPHGSTWTGYKFDAQIAAESAQWLLTRHNQLELYDLQTDPLEMNNLAHDPEPVKPLVTELNRKLDALVATDVGEDLGDELVGPAFAKRL